MNVKFKKPGIVTCPAIPITNIYSGKQYNCSAGTLTYGYKTDIFKDYGFDTALRWDAPTDKTNVNFMAYSYLCDPTVLYDISQEYVVSMYAYVSEDCNANFKLILEHSNMWVSNYQKTATTINDTTKGKVIWAWGRCKTSSSDGKMYIMFYPNTNQTNVFTTGYQLFAGITIYLGNEVYRPMNNSINGSGIIESPAPFKIGNNYITANDFIEF